MHQEAIRGNGADSRNIAVSPSFAVKFVYIKRADAATSIGGGGSISSMGDGAFDGFQNNTNQANRIQSMGTGTFELGSDASVNNSGSTYHWFALGGDDTDIKVGTYTGNAADNRAITGVGFQPEFLAIKGGDNGYANCRFGTTGDSSQFFGDVQNLANYIGPLGLAGGIVNETAQTTLAKTAAAVGLNKVNQAMLAQDKSLAAELIKKFGRLSVQNATKLGLSSESQATQ